MRCFAPSLVDYHRDCAIRDMAARIAMHGFVISVARSGRHIALLLKL
jgi:hypothetical protein